MSSDDQKSRESRDGTPASADESRPDAEDQTSDETAAPSEPEEPQEGIDASPPEAAGDCGPASDEPSAESAESPSTDADAPAETGAQNDDPPTATYYDDPYQEYEYNYQEPQSEKAAVDTAEPEPAQAAPPPPPPPVEDEDVEDDDDHEEGMSRMSFLEHLEELRTRIIRALIGLGLAYAIALTAKDYLFQLMRHPFDEAVATIKLTSPDVVIQLVALTPIEQFHLIWFKLPILASLFLAAPWWMLQAWSFIAPGLYKKERRWAVPFIMSGGILFILGGAFGYFVALNFALAFLLDVGSASGIVPMIGISSYSDMFIGILLGLGVVFQMPIVIFILTALRIASPQFLMRNVRYAILIIFVMAAVITPTPDIFNMITFAAPMILLFYVGILVSYLFLLRREGQSLPWGKIWLVIFILLAIIAAIVFYMYSELGYHLVREFPWFVPPG
ncbi:MAG: twin-arginine translocase subunit TatC [Acidobacteria bacterium]|nr:twin-arginine translocase subunit TatC [Acidobacteriota bacterium]